MAEEQTASALVTFIPLILMLVVFYFLLIRPQRKREKEEAAMRKSVDIGDSITTIGGVVGRVVGVKDEDTIVLETGADRVKLHFKRWAIRSKDTISDSDK